MSILQREYLVTRDGKEVSVLREHLTLEERRQIVRRLLDQAKSDIQLADRIEQDLINGE